MAKRRDLKKSINYVAGELFSEALLCNMFIPGTDKDKAEEVMSRIMTMQDDFLSRASRPDGKDNKALVREYYRKLLIDLQTEVNAIAGEIATLNK